jgi:carbon monoxide dehydrogenase subunit G
VLKNYLGENMKLEGEFTFNGSRQEVWDLLQDPDILVNSLPGAKNMKKIGDDEYQGEMIVKVGPLNGAFTANIKLKDKVQPQSYKMLVESKGNVGFANGTAEIELTEQEEKSTLMKYVAELQVGGRLASVGQRMLDTVGRSLTRQGLEAMNNALKARMGSDADEVEQEKFVPPSQSDIARGVAKDVMKESLLSNKVVWAIAAVVILLIVVWILVK